MSEKRTAIVTGAARGIGKGIALALAQDGYNVVVSDMKQADCDAAAKELQATGAEVIGTACNVTDPSAVETLFQKTVEKFGKVDVLVNNAGIYPFVPFSSMTEADWDKVMNVNLKGVFLCSKAAAKLLSAGGRIVNISSIASVVGFENLVHYCASKGGVNGMTRALALELARQNVTVNAVAPGAINTPGAYQDAKEEVKKQTAAMVPMARIGEPEDIANAVVFLASEKSSYITGQVLVVDGGWTLR